MSGGVGQDCADDRTSGALGTAQGSRCVVPYWRPRVFYGSLFLCYAVLIVEPHLAHPIDQVAREEWQDDHVGRDVADQHCAEERPEGGEAHEGNPSADSKCADERGDHGPEDD